MSLHPHSVLIHDGNSMCHMCAGVCVHVDPQRECVWGCKILENDKLTLCRADITANLFVHVIMYYYYYKTELGVYVWYDSLSHSLLFT
jgi:hypothetical protein